MTAYLLKHALYYAHIHWRVFPVVPKEKKPLIKGWRNRATTDKDQIKQWWKDDPDANIGIATGERSGIFVLDVDIDKHGDWSLKGLELLHGAMPITIVSHTGNGGRHLFFAHPGKQVKNSVSKLGCGLDTRGDGGYVLAPPSFHPNGNRYSWLQPPWLNGLAEFPQTLLKKIIRLPCRPKCNRIFNRPTTPAEGIFWVEQALTHVSLGGGRNDTCFWLACQLRDWGFDFSTARKYVSLYIERVPRRNHPFHSLEAYRALENAYESSRRRPATKVDE